MKKAFTLIELLVVIGIIALLLGMIFPTYQEALNNAKKTKAKTEAKNLEVAFKNYLDIYRVWPARSSVDKIQDSVIYKVTDETWKLFSIIQGNDMEFNPQKISFYEFDNTNLPKAAYDPWANSNDTASEQGKHVYYIMFDANYDNVIKIDNQEVRHFVIVWSAGPNGTNEYGNGDDIASWK